MAKRQPKATCSICGWTILAADGTCHRTELHWTRESLEAHDAKRRASRDSTRCPDCKGKGTTTERAQGPNGIMHSEFTCLGCNGSGLIR